MQSVAISPPSYQAFSDVRPFHDSAVESDGERVCDVWSAHLIQVDAYPPTTSAAPHNSSPPSSALCFSGVIVVSCWGAHTLPVPFALHVDDGEVTDEVSGALHERAFLGGCEFYDEGALFFERSAVNVGVVKTPAEDAAVWEGGHE